MPMMDRRAFVGSAAVTAAFGLVPAVLSAAGAVQAAQIKAAEQSGPFQLPPLPYAPPALEPIIDGATMELHHGKHHAAYVKNLNAALADAPQLAKQPLEALLAALNDVPESIRSTVRNNGGGHANHTMFWQIMGAPGGPGPDGELKAALERDFGGLVTLQESFNGMGSKVFGSGWVFITVDSNGKLDLSTKPNQDTPLMDGKRVLLGNDVWEHAYYLKYRNRRADYLKAWWNVVNWGAVADRYAKAKAGQLGI